MPRVSHSLQSATVILAVSIGSACATEPPFDSLRDHAPLAQVQPYATPSAAPFGCAGAKIALSTRSGFYVGAFFGGGFGMIATARSIGAPEMFTSIDLGASRVALQASSGHYVIAENGGGGSVYANEPRLSAATPFTLRPHGDGASITLQTPSNWYLNALLGGGTVMNTNTRAAGDWEALRVTCLDGELEDPERPDDLEQPEDPEQPDDPGVPRNPLWPVEPGDEWPGEPGLGG